MKARDITLIVLVAFSVFLSATRAEAVIYVTWKLDTTDKGEFITAFAHLYGVPQVEKEYNWYFCTVELDASRALVPDSGIIEVSIGDYAQPVRRVWEITQKKVYGYGLNPTFNDKVAQITTPTPVTVDLKITDKAGSQLYVDSKAIQMLPMGYYAWMLGNVSMMAMSPVLSTPHADPVQKVISAAARATPWNAILGYQEAGGMSHHDIVDYQMRAVYNVLQSLGVVYAHCPTTFSSTQAQRIRLPVQTLSDNSGNCIETTLLFDAIFEAIGFHTHFVFITGHVFLAVKEWQGSDIVLPLETTLVGSKSYDEARRVGNDEYSTAKNDPSYYEMSVQRVRTLGITPTPYMDKMPDGAKFYAKIDEVSTQIASARAAIKKLDDAAGTMKTIPSRVNELRTQAQSLFQIGKYQDAEKQASDALSLLTQSQTTTTTSEGGTAELALGLVFLAMPVALIVLVVLYVRSRRKSRQVTPAPAATSTRPKLKYCLQCGKEIPEETTFCRYCGASQTT